MQNSTLTVNFFAGPGTGKSTNSALLFGRLKQDGMNVEMVHEVAKEFTWEKRFNALSFAPYGLGKQMYRLHRLQNQVDVVITDSPILLYAIYGQGDGYDKVSFDDFLLDSFEDYFNNLNFFLRRNPTHHKYIPVGRNQTEEEAHQIDREVENYLSENEIEYTSILVDDMMYDKIYYKTKAVIANGNG